MNSRLLPQHKAGCRRQQQPHPLQRLFRRWHPLLLSETFDSIQGRQILALICAHCGAASAHVIYEDGREPMPVKAFYAKTHEIRLIRA